MLKLFLRILFSDALVNGCFQLDYSLLVHKNILQSSLEKQPIGIPIYIHTPYILFYIPYMYLIMKIIMLYNLLKLSPFFTCTHTFINQEDQQEISMNRFNVKNWLTRWWRFASTKSAEPPCGLSPKAITWSRANQEEPEICPSLKDVRQEELYLCIYLPCVLQLCWTL